MKNSLRQLFAPLLSKFENGEGAFAYKKSHRVVLVILGSLFLFLTFVVAGLGVSFGQITALIPGIVFLAVGGTALAVGTLGTDRAVSKIWGSK